MILMKIGKTYRPTEVRKHLNILRKIKLQIPENIESGDERKNKVYLKRPSNPCCRNQVKIKYRQSLPYMLLWTLFKLDSRGTQRYGT